ncbi:MAG: LysR family transcriptional regulator [Polyangiaceae bacterium]|nr:LysR family transcriptional regulator [Polyangiaceae bacterium]
MIDSLRHFVLIAEHGTFTSAARHAHLSQPALTASIQKLESDMGARLFHRDRTGTSLTAAGETLLPRALSILSGLDDARRAIREVEGIETGEVRLGAGATACTYLLPPVLAEFRESHQNVRFLLREATTTAVLDALAKGELDLGVVTHPGGELWRRDELILIASPSLPIRRGEPLPAPFVTFAVGSTSRDLLDQHFPGAHVVMELGSIAAVKGNVRAGIGIALVSRSAVQVDLALGRLVEIPHPKTPVIRPMHIVHRGKDRLPPAAAALRKLLLARKKG